MFYWLVVSCLNKWKKAALMIKKNGNRARVGGVRALFGCIFLISGLLTAVVVSGSEPYLSQSLIEASNDLDLSSIVVGDEASGLPGSQSVSRASENASERSDKADSSENVSSVGSAPDGASLLQDDSVALDEGSLTDHQNAQNGVSPEFIEYGYNNIHDSPADARSADSVSGGDFSTPVIMQSLEALPKSKTDSSQASHKDSEGNDFDLGLDKKYKQLKAQEELLEPLTEKVDVTTSPHKTPETQHLDEQDPTTTDTHKMHAGGHIESPPKSPEDFTMDDYGIKTEVRQLEPTENFQDVSASDVIFEDTSESKLPAFVAKEESKGEDPQKGEESSKLTSGLSETSEPGSACNLTDLESSALISQEKGCNREASVEGEKGETSLSSDILNSAEDQTRLFDLTEKSKVSQVEDSGSDLGVAEPSFVNPSTEDITMEPSETEARTVDSVSERVQHSVQEPEPSRTGSSLVEPPSPPSSAIEEKTVGNKRIYSGPYIRTSATAGKVSPRIASVINSLVGQFERLNLYGAGNKGEEVDPAEQNISNRFVSSMKDNFDKGTDGSSDFAPQNSQEEEFVEAMKSEQPRNTFLFKNRYEEMKATRNSSGKTLLQEEIEKLRGTYRNSLSKQFGTGKVWERPSAVQTRAPPILTSGSGNEFLDKVRMINPNYIQDESRASGALNVNHVGQTLSAAQPEREEGNQNAENGHFVRQDSNEDYVRAVTVGGSDKPQVTERETETTNEGDSDAEPFSRRLASRFEDSDTGAVDESGQSRSEDLNSSQDTSPKTGRSQNEDLQGLGDLNLSYDTSPKVDQVLEDTTQRQPRTNDYVAAPFSYINNVKELPMGLRPQDVPAEQVPEAILDRRSLTEEADDQAPGHGGLSARRRDGDPQSQETSISYSKAVELSPEQEREISICYRKAKKIKTVNFGLDLVESPTSVVTETFAIEFTKYRSKVKELVLFGQETLRVAEKYSKKRSWRKKTKKFKLEFLELSNEFLQHSKAVRSLLHHLIQVTSPNIMEILQQILTGHSHSKHAMLVQCKILYQAFYSYKNSVRSRLLKKISDLNFADVVREQIAMFLEQRFHPIVKAIQSNKYLKKKLSKQIPDVTVLTSASADRYQELSYAGDGEKTSPGKKKGNKFTRFFRRLFKRPCLKCLKSNKQSKKQKPSSSKKG